MSMSLSISLSKPMSMAMPLTKPAIPTDKETEEMFNPNISDYVRGFGMDEIQDEQDYEEWVQAGKPECVPVACPRGMRAAMRAAA
jgi:hypothetical protein